MQRSFWKGTLAGMAGGLVGSLVMNVYMGALSKAEEMVETPEQKQQEAQSEGEDTTVKVADIATRKLSGHPLSKEGKQTGGSLVHYAFGTVMGGIYGASTEYMPWAKAGFGTLFASALFVGADELSLPALSLAKWPTEEPASAQVEHWAAHLVFGATTEGVRRLVRGKL